ncbi:MAG: transposase [Burkholderia sp.]
MAVIDTSKDRRQSGVHHFRSVDTTLLDTEKPDSRKGRPNHSPEFRRRIAIAACEPGVSVAKLAREHGPNANLAFTWRHRYRAEPRASEATLLTVTVVSDMRPEVIAVALSKPEIAKPAVPVGTIEVYIGRAVVKVDSVVDPDMLRTVLESLRS